VFPTPAHPQPPDADRGSARGPVSDVYDLDVDTGPLEGFAGAVAQHCAELGERVGCAVDEERPDDRLFVEGETDAEPSTRHFTPSHLGWSMKRRALLGTLASLAVAGCIGGDPGDGTTATTRPTTPGTTDATTDATTTESGTPPEVRDIGVPVGDADCPFDGENVERVVCYPERADAPLSLEPADDELGLPSDRTTFTLENATEHAFSLNFYDWALHKRVDGRWFFVTPSVVPEPLHTLPAGESHDWTFAVDNGEVPSGGPSSDSAIGLAGLGGGEYAFAVSGWFESGDHEHRIGAGARLHLDGDRLELTRPDGYTGSRDAETVVVTPDDASSDPTEAFVVERVGEAGVPSGKPTYHHIAEQLVRPEPGANRLLLRDALAFFADGVTTVRVEEAAEFDTPFPRDEHYFFEYRSGVYEARVETVE